MAQDANGTAAASVHHLGWIGVMRLGLVQTALGAIIVLTTSTVNRVMVVELALPAMLPGALVGWHYALQMLRPRWGFGSDKGHRVTPWIIGGMAVLAMGGAGSAVATAIMGVNLVLGTLLAILAFTLIGVGVGAAGTSLLVLLAKRVSPERRPAAASMVWLMMIAGFAVTATVAGRFLDPYSPERLVLVTSAVSGLAFLIAVLAVAGVERGAGPVPEEKTEKLVFRQALAEVWAEPQARLFSIFVFISMLAYSAQDLILEPFAGVAFGFTPGRSTALAGIQHGGVFVGMILVAVIGSALKGARLGSPTLWAVLGCLGSAASLLMLSAIAHAGAGAPVRETVFALGLCNGVYAGAAIASMMMLAGSGSKGREGTRMGLWGAAQAIAFGIGGFAGTVAADLGRQMFGSALTAYAIVFTAEALLFLISALLVLRVSQLASVTSADLSASDRIGAAPGRAA